MSPRVWEEQRAEGYAAARALGLVLVAAFLAVLIVVAAVLDQVIA